MKKLLLIVVIFLVLIVVAVYTAPARLVTPLLEKTNAPVQLQGVSGSVWQGRAEHLLHQGKDRGAFSWQVSPLSLLRGRPEATLALEGQSLNGKAHLIKEGDRLHISQATANVSASLLEPILDIPALNLQGDVQITLDELVLQGRFPTALQGKAVWNNAAVTGSDAAELGTLSATFGSLPGGGFGGTVEDEGGPLLLEGQFKTNLLSYEADAILQARDDNPQVQRVLQHIGQLQPDGSVLFEVKGGLGR